MDATLVWVSAVWFGVGLLLGWSFTRLFYMPRQVLCVEEFVAEELRPYDGATGQPDHDRRAETESERRSTSLEGMVPQHAALETGPMLESPPPCYHAGKQRNDATASSGT